ncbi:MAG: GNAT family N-acetyltransferase [Bacteroidia bacterium]
MHVELLQHHEIDLAAWDELVVNSPQGSIFMQSWYINAMLGQWQGIVVYDKNRNLQAVMPLYIKTKYFLEYSLQPILAKYWGICLLKNTFPNYYEEYSWKKKVVEAIVEAIPQKLSKFHHNFHPNFDYILPFYWKKYELLTKFTYILPLKNTSEKIEDNFSKSVLKKLKKAGKNELEIKPENDVDLLLKLFEENERSNKLILPKSHYQDYINIQKACAEHNQCFMLSAFNEKNEGIASSLFLQDSHTTYFLSGIVSPAYRQSAAMPLLVTEALKKAAETTQNFDFLGSMMESIESFFRSFGPKPVPYMAARKNTLPFI